MGPDVAGERALAKADERKWCGHAAAAVGSAEDAFTRRTVKASSPNSRSISEVNMRTTAAPTGVVPSTVRRLQRGEGPGEAREQGEPLAVVHPMEVLDWSYRRVKPEW